MDNIFSIRSRIMHFRHGGVDYDSTRLEYIEDGIIEVAAGRIQAIGHAQDMIQQGYDERRCEHLPKQLIIAGFIDLHVHAPQLDVIASFGEQLMEWLQQYTFPAELQFANEGHSRMQTDRFVRLLLANGTTTAMVFTTSFKHSVDHIFSSAQAINMRLIAGKVMMDRHAPEALLDTSEQSQRDNHTLIERWHNRDRLSYALTPRFAGTSTPEQLRLAGETLSRYSDIYVQTHLSENCDEIAWTSQLFPEASDYLNVYERFGLVNENTVFAHCIHLTESERQRVRDAGSTIAFCPSSNLFLGSGLFDLVQASQLNIPVALASDVGAGTSLSPFKTMCDAYKVCQLKSYALSAAEAFYRCSLGAATALGLEKKIGNLAANTEADFVVLDSANIPEINHRLSLCETIEEELFVYMISGDERLIDRTYVAGVKQYDYKQASL